MFLVTCKLPEFSRAVLSNRNFHDGGNVFICAAQYGATSHMWLVSTRNKTEKINFKFYLALINSNLIM